MTEVKDTIISEDQAIPEVAPVAAVTENTERPANRNNNRGQRGNAGGRGRSDRRSNDRQAQDEFDQKILDIARVTRVMAGGKRMRFRACVAIGDRKGRVAIGLAKGLDVTIAVNKAVNQAKKNLITVPMIDKTIPHEIKQKSDAALILLKPAKQGRGIIAGSVVRVILELAGIHNITSKMLGSHNKINNAKCVIKALSNLKKPVSNHRQTVKPVVTPKIEAEAEVAIN
ncbi:30S ribosomal protein S5 [Candidatus Falkowbacteria bacterium]|nr:30S ribosomal protein S5 [Candidatus Falkowbacteria bacterium]